MINKYIKFEKKVFNNIFSDEPGYTVSATNYILGVENVNKDHSDSRAYIESNCSLPNENIRYSSYELDRNTDLLKRSYAGYEGFNPDDATNRTTEFIKFLLSLKYEGITPRTALRSTYVPMTKEAAKYLYKRFVPINYIDNEGTSKTLLLTEMDKINSISRYERIDDMWFTSDALRSIRMDLNKENIDRFLPTMVGICQHPSDLCGEIAISLSAIIYYCDKNKIDIKEFFEKTEDNRFEYLVLDIETHNESIRIPIGDHRKNKSLNIVTIAGERTDGLNEEELRQLLTNMGYSVGALVQTKE